MRQSSALDRVSWPFLLYFLNSCFAVLAAAEEARPAQSVESISDHGAHVHADQGKEKNLGEDTRASSTQDEEVTLAQAENRTPISAQEANEIPTIPLACKRGGSVEFAFIGAKVLKDSLNPPTDVGWYGFDLSSHYNFGGFSIGGIFQLTGRLEPRTRNDSYGEKITGFALEPRILFPLGNPIALYLGLRGGFSFNEGSLFGAGTSGLLMSFNNTAAAHAGVAAYSLWFGEVSLFVFRVGMDVFF